MKRALIPLMALIMVSLLLIPVAGAELNSTNTVIVLPTTKIVDGIPLHIGEDAITGSRLGAFLVLQGVGSRIYTAEVSVPVEFHSVLLNGSGFYTLNRRDMPDVGINVSSVPSPESVVVGVNFSRVGFNESSGGVYFLDRSVEVIFGEKTNPAVPRGNYTSVFSRFDGRDALYVYSIDNVSGESKSVGESLTVAGWTLRFLDINVNSSKLLVEVRYPDGGVKPKIMVRGWYYLMFTDFEGNSSFLEYREFPGDELESVLKSGMPEVLLFRPSDLFAGVNGTEVVTYDYVRYKKVGHYVDGDVYRGQWVWSIDSANRTSSIYLHVEPEKGFERVLIKPGERLPIPFGNLSIVPVFREDSSGKVEGVEGYRFVRREVLRETASITAPEVNATDNVSSFIINDTALTSLPRDRNVIIVGGWVSNSAWKLLEKVYDNRTIARIKVEIIKNGYVVERLKNPYNPRYEVIILAGRTYALTRKAVEEFMASFG